MATARFTGQTYGQATEQEQSQQAVPPGVSPVAQQAQQMAAQSAPVQRPRPGAQPFNRPTERPNEPITAGSPFGPGTNVRSFRPRKFIPVDDVEENINTLLRMFPNDGLRFLAEKLRERRR